MSPHSSASFPSYDELTCLPYGVAHGDEGISLLVRMGPHRILLDCGLEDISALKTEGKPPADLVLCSHAHPDHARGLLALRETFPQLPIYASEVTTQLLPLNWPQLNSAQMPQLFQALPWRSPVEVQNGLVVELFPAGHLPGAAALLLTYTAPHRSYTLLYTGDYFLSNSRLVEGLPLEALRGLEPDVLIVEGSYGTSRHPHRRQQENQLVERINQAISQQQSVVLPVPTLGLGQELLMLLRSHHLFTGRNMDIWVDGTVAAGCDAYLELLPHLPTSVQNFARHQPLFWDERVRPRVRHLLPEQRSSIGQTPCIVLTDETADFEEYFQTGSWVLLMPQHPGRQDSFELSSPQPSPQPTGRRQRRGAMSEMASPERKISPHIRQYYLLAQHSDVLGTTQLIHNLRPQHVIFVHGSPTYLSDLTGLDELHNRYHLHSPSSGTLVDLPVGETFLQPAAPTETNYEGELNELETVVTITLPDTITADPRWSHFADTGLVEVRWQGEELVLRGLSQRELLSQGSEARVPTNVACCGNCRYQRGQRCWNSDSPLYGFKVTLEGYCPVFEPTQPSLEE